MSARCLVVNGIQAPEATLLAGDSMVKKAGRSLPVSANNPCPFLRALVSAGTLSDDREPLENVAAAVAATALAGDGHPDLPRKAIWAIGLVANGLGPLSILDTRLRGMRLNALRGGPLDKKGAGSGILDAHGLVVAKQLARLRGFAKAKVSDDGSSEPGLAMAELRAYMDANFERAKGRRRCIDRTLMIGEWPVLLRVMGKQGPAGRYLSFEDVVELFTNRRLPERMNQRLAATAQMGHRRAQPARRSGRKAGAKRPHSSLARNEAPE
jgi:hypothetical protein